MNTIWRVVGIWYSIPFFLALLQSHKIWFDDTPTTHDERHCHLLLNVLLTDHILHGDSKEQQSRHFFEALQMPILQSFSLATVNDIDSED